MTAPFLEVAEEWCVECGELREGFVNCLTAVWSCSFCSHEQAVNTGVDVELPRCPGHDVMVQTGDNENDWLPDIDYCDGSCQ
jgi:xanthine dehydrogenase iron-sulfur cluster and FAD-binding subunit A